MRPAALLLVVSASIASPSRVPAQGEDARPIRTGTLRVVLAPDWARANRRFGEGTPGFATGALEPLSVDYGAESLGTAQLTFLAPAEASVRGLTGLSSFALNVGRARLSLNSSVRVVPIGFELGITRRISLSVAVPLVRARMEAFMLGPDTSAAGAATRGNVGFNPALLTAGAMDGFRSEAEAALRALVDAAANGPPALQAQAQATLDDIAPLVCGLYSLAGGGATDPTSPCFAPGAAMSPFLPLEASEAGDSLTARLLREQQDYAAIRTSLAGQGFTIPAFSASFTLPDAPLDSLGMRRFFTDRNGPLAADSLTTVVRTRLGDVEAAASFQIADRPRFRSQAGILVRLPTGSVDSKDNLIDIGTGDHQLDIEFATRNDLVVNGRFWVHAGARFGIQLADELDRRVSPANLPWAPVSSTARVKRDLGDYVAIDVVPNWQLDDAFSVGIGWHWFRQGETVFEYADPADLSRIGLPASVLGQETRVNRTRIGAGVTFSTLSRYAVGRASLPYTVTASFQSTFRGDGGNVPQAGVFHLTIRGYIRLRD